jgi:hypothetical protein
MQHFPSRNCSGGNLQARRENGREGSLEIYGTKAVVRLSVEVLKLKIDTSTDKQTSELIKKIVA